MTRDYEQFPDDDNGNVLWQMHEDGDDLTEPHEIEYSIAFTTQEQAENVLCICWPKNKKFHYSKMKNLTQLNGSLPFMFTWNQSIQTLSI